ncbi:MAG: hypothetical protein ACOYOU_21315, partial [Kiritimatiellia bacterium]
MNATVRFEKGGKKMKKGHSEEYFKEDRDFWWNHDFLELMARRLRLDECRSLLDAMLTRFKSEHSRMVHAIKEKTFSTGG